MADIYSRFKEKMNEPADEHEVVTQQKTAVEAEKPVQQEAVSGVELNDDVVLKYLSERQGKQISSFDDMFKDDEPKISFANEDVAKINKFVSETGRSPHEYFKINEDLSSKSDVDILRESYLEKGGSEEDFKIQYDLDISPLSEDDGYTSEDVNSRNREIKKRDLRIKEQAKSERAKISELHEKLSQPIEGFVKPEEVNQKGKEHWKASVTEAVKDLDLGIEGFKYEANPKELIERYSSIESIMDRFKDETGNFSYKKMIKSFETIENLDSILKVVASQSENVGTEKVIREIERPSGEQFKGGGSQMDPEEAKMRQRLKNYR